MYHNYFLEEDIKKEKPQSRMESFKNTHTHTNLANQTVFSATHKRKVLSKF